MKARTFLASLLLAAVSLVGCNSTKSVVDKVRSSILRVTMNVEGENGVCTAFMIKSKKALTAAHCVAPQMQADGKEAKVVLADKYFDLAVLDVESDKAALIIRDEPVADGEHLIAIGYAWGWAYPVDSKVVVIAPAVRPTPDAPVGIIVNGGYYHGMSGGPVVDVFGNVVGMVQRTNDGAGYGVGTAMIKAFLVDAGVE